MRRGVFGGTFDPPHIGHLIVAQDAAEALALDEVLFLPAGSPPHKPDSITPAAIRLELVAAATEGDSRFRVDGRETRRAGPSWTVDTLRELRASFEADDLVLLLGADQYAEFGSWRDPGGIRTLCTIGVLDRAGDGSVEPGDVRVPVTRIDISSSAVRERVRTGAPIRYLVPPAVETLIRRHALYRPAREAAGGIPDRNDAGRPV